MKSVKRDRKLVAIPEPLHRRLRSRAAREGRMIGALTVEAITAYLAPEKKAEAPATVEA